jgi:hypothetical protein
LASAAVFLISVAIWVYRARPSLASRFLQTLATGVTLVPLSLFGHIFPLPTGVEEQSTVRLAHQLGADHYSDSSYGWYLLVASVLHTALGTFVVIGVVGATILVNREIGAKTTQNEAPPQPTPTPMPPP